MAYKFQVGAAQLSGALVQEGAIAVHNEAGAKVADFSQTGVVSGSGQLKGASLAADGAAVLGGSVTAGTSFIIGSADLNEADMEKLDGITDGTVAANKAVVVDASLDANGFRNIDGSGDLTMGTITMPGFSVDADGDLSGKSLISTSTISGSGAISGASFAADGAAVLGGSLTAVGVVAGGAISAATSVDGSGDLTMGTITMAGFSVDADGDLSAKSLISTTTISGTTNLEIGGTVRLDGVSDADAAAVAADSFYFFDATDSLVKRESMADYATAIAGEGLDALDGELEVAVSGAVVIHNDKVGLTGSVAGSGLSYNGSADHLLSLDVALGELTPGDIAAGDFFAFIDTNAADAMLKDTVDDLAALFASKTNGGLSADQALLEVDLSDLAGAAINVATDSVAFIDADDDSVSKKESIADLATAMAGTGITATAGVFSVSAASTPTAFSDEASTMVEGLNYASEALTAARVLTLPDIGDLLPGEFVKIKLAEVGDFYADVVISVGSGDLIDGDASIRLESPYAAVNLYKVAENVWRIL